MREEILVKIQNLTNVIEYPTSESMRQLIMAGMVIALLLGLVNVFLGFRLMRFWMMIGSLCMGVFLGIGGNLWLDISWKICVMAGVFIGILLALLSFFVYNWGVFVLGTGIGSFLGIYFLRPSTSSSFFFCILMGVLIGILGMKFSRVILIIGTSVVGGLLAGLSGAWLGGLAYVPGPLGISYGILMGAILAFMGVLIQFAMNPTVKKETKDTGILEGEELEEQERTGHIRRDEFGRKYRE